MSEESGGLTERPQSNASRLQKLSHILAQSIPVLTESTLLHEGE